jgi:hypothetical protein
MTRIPRRVRARQRILTMYARYPRRILTIDTTSSNTIAAAGLLPEDQITYTHAEGAIIHPEHGPNRPLTTLTNTPALAASRAGRRQRRRR